MQQSPYAAREQARWITENASRFICPDAARYYKPGTKLADVFPALALKYNPNQPRVPAGNPDGGQWTDGEGGAGQWTDGAGGAARPAKPMGNIGITDRRVVSDADPESVKPGAQHAQVGSDIKDPDGLPYYARGGHHEMPKSVYEKWDLQPETRKVFNDSTTGSLPAGKIVDTPDGPIRGHYWDGSRGIHRAYNDAVEELSERFMRDRGITKQTMTPEQARELLAEIRKTDDTTIRNYNRGIRMLRRYYRLFRGRE